MKQNQINISSNQSVSIYGTSTPNLIFGGNADDYTFQYCDEEIYMTENDYEKINPSYINVNYIRGYIFHKTVFLYFRFYFEQESSGTSVWTKLCKIKTNCFLPYNYTLQYSASEVGASKQTPILVYVDKNGEISLGYIPAGTKGTCTTLFSYETQKPITNPVADKINVWRKK